MVRKYYVRTVTVTDVGVLVTDINKINDDCHIKTSGEKGPFSSLTKALDACNKRGYMFTTEGVQSFMKESLKEVKDQLSKKLASLKCYDDV